MLGGANCGIYWDTDNADTFVFMGNEDNPWVNGVHTPSYVFSGVQVARGPGGSAPAEGAVNSFNKWTAAASCTTEKGKITYSRTNGSNQDVVFIGTWKAHY
jgi:hypothetical protein